MTNSKESNLIFCFIFNIQIVALLLEMKANVNIKDNRSDTSLHRLVSLGRLELLETLLKNDPKPKVDVQNSEGNTPL